MIKSLREKLVDVIPDWLFPFLSVPYWALHPRRERVFLLCYRDYWFLKREDGSIMFMPRKGLRAFSWEDPYERYFRIEPGETVLDVGACIGEFTVPAAKRAREVVAIEPNPENRRWLRRNIAENGLRNVRVVGKAAWNRRASLRLWISEENIGGHSVIGDRGGDNIEVQADTLDNIVSDLGIEKVDFVKMDVEGAELQVLKGAKKVLTMAKKITMETHLGINGEMTTFKVQSILKNHGFHTRTDPHSCLEMVYGGR